MLSIIIILPKLFCIIPEEEITTSDTDEIYDFKLKKLHEKEILNNLQLNYEQIKNVPMIKEKSKFLSDPDDKVISLQPRIGINPLNNILWEINDKISKNISDIKNKEKTQEYILNNLYNVSSADYEKKPSKTSVKNTNVVCEKHKSIYDLKKLFCLREQ